MAIDKDKKIEIQQKLIEQLTSENEKLKQQLDFEINKSNEVILHEKQMIANLEQSKKEYDELIKELKELKSKYVIHKKILKELTTK